MNPQYEVAVPAKPGYSIILPCRVFLTIPITTWNDLIQLSVYLLIYYMPLMQ